jgi:hypothetical protein
MISFQSSLALSMGNTVPHLPQSLFALLLRPLVASDWAVPVKVGTALARTQASVVVSVFVSIASQPVTVKQLVIVLVVSGNIEVVVVQSAAVVVSQGFSSSPGSKYVGFRSKPIVIGGQGLGGKIIPGGTGKVSGSGGGPPLWEL